MVTPTGRPFEGKGPKVTYAPSIALCEGRDAPERQRPAPVLRQRVGSEGLRGSRRGAVEKASPVAVGIRLTNGRSNPSRLVNLEEIASAAFQLSYSTSSPGNPRQKAGRMDLIALLDTPV